LGREATVFQKKNSKLKTQNSKLQLKTQKEEERIGCQISYKDITDAIKQDPNTDWEIGYTIEFYPEEGKYHYTGHRNCGIKQEPAETVKKGVLCPVCGKKLTIGVMHRVEQLAGRSEEELKIFNFQFSIFNKTEIIMIKSKTFPKRPPFVRMVPLLEIIAESFGSPVTGKRAQDEYQKLTDVFGGEFPVLLEKTRQEIAQISGERIAEGIEKVRSGDIVVDPGYDGVFGVVKIWPSLAKASEGKSEIKEKKEQMSLF
jgi:PHP family Zn ribbon phosphoesterase